MEKLGKNFSRDVEFTGSCDVSANLSSRLLSRMKKHGFKMEGMVRGRNIEFPTGKEDFPKDPEAGKSVEIDLNDDQKKLIKDITGKSSSKLRILINASGGSADMELTDDQYHEIESALGLGILTLHIESDPIETELL